MSDNAERVISVTGVPFTVREYPVAGPDAPLIVWVHGGGFMGGDIDMPESDAVARSLVEAGIAVITVDYALAPTLPGFWGVTESTGDPANRFPTASVQVTAAVDDAVSRATALGASPTRVALGGASAGGNLAAGAALRRRDAHAPAPAALLLAYPVLHAVVPQPDAELAQLLAPLPTDEVFPDEVTRIMNSNYAPDSLDDPYAFPGGHHLRGLPATLIINSEADRLRTSGEAFASELALAGVDVTVVRERGTTHGHLNRPDEAGYAQSLTRMADWLHRIL